MPLPMLKAIRLRFDFRVLGIREFFVINHFFVATVIEFSLQNFEISIFQLSKRMIGKLLKQLT